MLHKRINKGCEVAQSKQQQFTLCTNAHNYEIHNGEMRPLRVMLCLIILLQASCHLTLNPRSVMEKGTRMVQLVIALHHMQVFTSSEECFKLLQSKNGCIYRHFSSLCTWPNHSAGQRCMEPEGRNLRMRALFQREEVDQERWQRLLIYHKGAKGRGGGWK